MQFDFSHQFSDEEMPPAALKRIGIFGCSGSIGKQTLEVIRLYPHFIQSHRAYCSFQS